MDSWQALLEIAAMLAASVLVGVLFERIGLNALSGFLLAGVILGPGGLHIVSSGDMVTLLAELGVSLLLFAIGLEFSIKRLRSLGLKTLMAGVLQICLTALLVYLAAIAMGIPGTTAIVIGLVAAPSSTAVALRVMRDNDAIDTPHGRNTLGVLLLQDLAIVPLVLVVSTLGSGATGLEMTVDFGKAIGVTAGLFFGFWLVIKFIIPLVLNTTAANANRDLFIIIAAVVFILAVWVAHYFKVSPALGAFVAGVLMAESNFAPQIRADVSALRALFVTFFFVSVGMLADLSLFLTAWVDILLVVTALMIGKILLITFLFLAFKQPIRHSVATGLGLGMIGEFSFLLLEVGTSSGVLSPETSMVLLSATIISLLISPLMVAAAGRLGEEVEKLLIRLNIIHPKSNLDVVAIPAQGHFLVIGLGPAGKETIDALRKEGAEIVALDLNPKLVSAIKAEGVTAMVGDAVHPEVLEHVHATSASAIVVAIPDRSAVLNIVKQVRMVCPHTPVIARSRWNRFSNEILLAGATSALDEETTIGSYLGKEAMRYF